MTYGKIWDGFFIHECLAKPKISLCTTVMNRLSDLKQTLPINLEYEKYPNIEFVILDYNSNDGLSDWIKNEMMMYIQMGKLVYARTDEPKYYSMTHSRNMAFKVASGDICINVDADNFLFDKNKMPPITFGEYVSWCSSQQTEKAIFAKGKRLCHGRLGFYKKEFIESLGGYDEQITGYGHDEIDLMYRAWGLDYTLMYCGGQYVDRLHTSNEKRNANMLEPWRTTEDRNKKISYDNLANKRFKANEGKEWGKGKVIVNWEKEMIL